MPPIKRNKPAVGLTSNMYPLCSRMSNDDARQLGCVAHTNLQYDLGSPYSPFTKVTGSNFLSDIILLYLYIIHRCCRRWCWCWKRLWKSFKRVRNSQTQECKQSERQTTAIHRKTAIHMKFFDGMQTPLCGKEYLSYLNSHSLFELFQNGKGLTQVMHTPFFKTLEKQNSLNDTKL